MDGGVSGKRIVCFVSAPIRNETERFSSMEKVYLLSLKVICLNRNRASRQRRIGVQGIVSAGDRSK